MAACDSLWTAFQGANPLNCVVTPGICPEDQVCNAQTHLCEFPSDGGLIVDGGLPTDGGLHELRLLAGGIGTYGDIDGTGAAARFGYPNGLTADDLGNLYVADANNHTIRKVVVSTGAVTTLAGTARGGGSADGTGAAARFSFPRDVTNDGFGNLYVADSDNFTIRKIVVSTGAVTTLAGMAGSPGSADGVGSTARFGQPLGVAADDAGNLYVADRGNHTIRKVVVSTGAVTTLAGTAGSSGSTDGTGAAARFNQPWRVTTDGAGNLYIADLSNSTIRKVVVNTGAVTTLAGTAGSRGSADGLGADARFNQPTYVTSDSAGNLYVADRGNNTIRKIELASARVTTVVGIAGLDVIKLGTLPGGLDSPDGVAVLPTGEMFISDSHQDVILSVY